ncbi:D-arabinose 1-dehydrogenase, Zn-dependent alcohol dehydrogenase family [Prauserella marina]|uniref:D-arabinose 1-dehydrogenase, Zn-dependent alcohol dehydrogenase family n=1 Tax=Prauserella marina TaxID=530584 RepID=A0A1G6RMF2_9PSEU|nr:D-arabinose 1-dehydrogenase-like Zn-dependent alcohol dehydrogenase [Prauserella marina]SDD05175.1 D-arabinose 1-dehydrogenase, Zn-dependent alcohol dehydrogenase family [Prauserella marina]
MISAKGTAGVEEVAVPVAAQGDAVVDVERVGVCGTDVELFTGEMEYLHDGNARYPIRIGHEWMGTVTSVGAGVDPAWVGRRVTGDTMLGCGHCRSCAEGTHWVCEFRTEIGIRGGRAGALAERLAVPGRSLHALPETVGGTAGALVEPGGNALRAVRAAGLDRGDRVLILGPGTIGLLAAMFARAAGAEVHLLGATGASLEFARSLGFRRTWTEAAVPAEPFDAVIDASNAPSSPSAAARFVRAGKRVVYIGLSGAPSLLDTRSLVLKDVTAVGVLSASPGLAGTIEHYADGSVDPSPLVAATVGLADVAAVLAGERPSGAGPKIHVDPRR